MTSEDLLGRVLELQGVLGAALVSPTGVSSVAVPEGGLADFVGARELLSGALASSRALTELLCEGSTEQTILEFRGGALLLAINAIDAPTPLSVVALCGLQDLGRVRFGLRRLLPQLTAS